MNIITKATILVAIGSAVVFISCKTNNYSQLQSDTGSQPSKVTSIHGSVVPTAVKEEILLAISGSNSGIDVSSIALTSPKEISGAALQGDAYVAKCRANNVPIPPDWGDTRWKKVQTLESGRIFALDPGLLTELYSFRDPKIKGGTCAALPRSRNGVIQALGIICQSPKGIACFWDNKERTPAPGGLFQKGISDPSRIKPEIIANGDNLVENCSSCHRGSNVFILHSEGLQELDDSDAEDIYKPQSDQSTWSNKLIDADMIPNCADCHGEGSQNELGQLDFDYCNAVMMPSIESSRNVYSDVTNRMEKVDIHDGKGPPMPPPGSDRDDFIDDIKYIKDTCRSATQAVGGQWDWN